MGINKQAPTGADPNNMYPNNCSQASLESYLRCTHFLMWFRSHILVREKGTPFPQHTTEGRIVDSTAEKDPQREPGPQITTKSIGDWQEGNHVPLWSNRNCKRKQLEILKRETCNFFTRKKTKLKQRAKTIGRETELKEITVRERARILLGDPWATKIKQAFLIGGNVNLQRILLPARNETYTH